MQSATETCRHTSDRKRNIPLGRADIAISVPIITGGQLLAVWSANASAVYLAFNATAQALANMTAARNPLEQDAFYDDLFSTEGNGSFNAAAADPFRGLLGSPGLAGLSSVRHCLAWLTELWGQAVAWSRLWTMTFHSIAYCWQHRDLTLRKHACEQVITNVSGSTLPARIGCTGFAEGGALAKLAATWAGAAYANAEGRSIVFGAPQIGDARCASVHVPARMRCANPICPWPVSCCLDQPH